MPKYKFDKLLDHQWVEQETLTAKGRVAAKRRLEEANQIDGDKKNPSRGGIWRLRKVPE